MWWCAQYLFLYLIFISSCHGKFGAKKKYKFNKGPSDLKSLLRQSDINNDGGTNYAQLLDENVRLQRRQRSQVPGGVTEEDPNNPIYKNLAKESLAEYIRVTGTLNCYGVEKVEKVTKQIVEGIHTNIYFKISRVFCQPNGNIPPNSLELNNVGNCHLKVWTTSWLNKETINLDCDVKEQKGGPGHDAEEGFGLVTKDDPNKPLYTELAKISLAQFIRMSGTLKDYRVLKVEKVTTQIVAGDLINIDFKISVPFCQLDSDVQSNCVELEGYGYGNCHSKVWTQAWFNMERITVDCNVEKQKRNHRHHRRDKAAAVL